MTKFQEELDLMAAQAVRLVDAINEMYPGYFVLILCKTDEGMLTDTVLAGNVSHACVKDAVLMSAECLAIGGEEELKIDATKHH